MAVDPVTHNPWYRDPDNGEAGWTILETAIDWLTLTSIGPQSGTVLYDYGRGVIDQLEGQGNRKRPWRWQGYTGACCSGVSTGWRLDGAILRASGEQANEVARFVPLDKYKITRIDLQVTARRESGRGENLRVLWSSLKNHPQRNENWARTTLIESSDGGATLNIGDRARDVYLRIYNKHAEDRRNYPVGAYRWEVELKNATAQTEATQWTLAEDKSDFVRRSVQSWFDRSHIIVPWSDGRVDRKWHVPRPRTDVDRLSLWLSTTVRDAIDVVSIWQSEDEILEALGFTLAAKLIRQRRAKQAEGGTT
jgi:hypothetical protein